MLDKIARLSEEINSITVGSLDEIEVLRIKWLGKKGEITLLFEDFKGVAPEQKKEVGQQLNILKTSALSKINASKEQFESTQTDGDAPDLSLPGFPSVQNGSRHPLSIIKNQIIDIFSRM